MTNIIRTKKGGAPGKIIGSIVILVWVFFLLKFGIGYLSFRAQLKSYIPVTAEVVNTIEHKDTVTNEEGRRTTERTYTVDIKYMYNGLPYNHTLKLSSRPNSEMVVFVDPYDPNHYIRKSDGNNDLFGLVGVILFFVFATILNIPRIIRIQRGKQNLLISRQQYYDNLQNGTINTAEYDIFNSRSRAQSNNKEEKTGIKISLRKESILPKFTTDFDKSGETIFLDQQKK